MKKASQFALITAALFTGWVGGTLSSPARADGLPLDLTPVRVSVGPQISQLQCPCFRWVIYAEGVGGKIKLHDFLISTDSLFNFREESGFDFQPYAVREFNAGALEALWKNGTLHVGLGFNGVTWGKDRDLGYSDLLKTGFYGLLSLVLNPALTLDLHAGYDFDTKRVNNGPVLDRDLLDQAAILKWTSDRWSGNVSGHIGLDASHLTQTTYLDTGAAAKVRARIFTLHELELGMSLNVSYEHDGLRNFMGLDPDLLSANLMMDLSYVASSSAKGSMP